ncbi:DNA-packaging protein [Jannaschia seohaensis]|uniref:Large terminase phage packaging protein n=1 Tax=Jannaschia seohaensis TaxID=475081 RepID=A0A2Y9AU77_9RHOB|nr:terminase family protein [Jannaschia seohaensis]PWJ19143.1 phage terminase large subunit-like protein [Jannaschia seohaensis]SSA45799.1 Large terminase phage packaging protein [Jannaschia seohaensis]
MEGLSDNALGALPWLFDFWALPHQVAPEGDWRTWVILGGRGAGKTRAGSEWVRAQVEGSRPLMPGRARRVALVGETYEQVRDVMIEGESGILACTPPDRRPRWVAGQRKLVWPNGAEAQAFSAHDPEALRGPQFDAAWVDELAKWKRGQETWDNLQFCLRLGTDPRAVVTTTPRNVEVLKELLGRASTVSTHAPTDANRAHLARPFLEEVRAKYAGTRLGRQELDGVLLEDMEGAFWTTAALDALRVDAVPEFDRVVVGVDPAVSSGGASDETGIVVVGAVTQGPPATWRAWVLADASVSAASPTEWAAAVAAAYANFGADRVVAEGNQGGEMIEAVLRQVAPFVSYRKVTARQAKGARAEPVAALYEQGRVRHRRGLGRLEDQMCRMGPGGYQGRGSPDRVDALVWAMWDAMLDPARARGGPTVRVL